MRPLRSSAPVQLTHRVDGALLVDLRVDDPRTAYFTEHPEFATVAVADPSAAPGLTTVWTDDAEAMREAVRALAELGHRRIARVAGLPGLAHTQIRDAAFREETAALGCEGLLLRTDYSPEQGVAVTEEALRRPDAPHGLRVRQRHHGDRSPRCPAALGRALPG
ncbi:LacI family transcriptional regulator [Microbacterium sp. XT11]|uniref:LacI family transcriptional regulator n=1 Tax=Microbacterium sp. XT11 TaxID=367477 RepID=UPI0008303BD5|nr:LacI family transcriptional regulator [Microbacterium sp. XT11]